MSRRKLEIVLAAMVLCAGLTMAWVSAGPSEEHILRDIDGVVYGTVERLARAKWSVLFFLMTDCPIANRYAPEIQRICATYGPKGAQCFLVYVDPSTTAAAVRKHLQDYSLSTYPAILDPERKLVKKAGVSVSSEVAVFTSTGELRYRGRIDNFYAGLGSPRPRATEHDLRDALDALISGRAVPHPMTQAFGCFIE